ncbi:transposase, partial [Arthrobacter sp. E918]|nr:transposase [Arthrobacter mobilis]
MARPARSTTRCAGRSGSRPDGNLRPRLRVIDSQSAKGADTAGLLAVVLVTAASLQDRDGGRRVLEKTRAKMPSIVQVWADGGYAGHSGAVCPDPAGDHPG